MKGLFDDLEPAPPPEKPKHTAPRGMPVEVRWDERLRSALEAALATSEGLRDMFIRDYKKKGVEYGRTSDCCPITLYLQEHPEVVKAVPRNARVECGRECVYLCWPAMPRQEFHLLPQWAVDFIAEMEIVVPREPVDLPVKVRIAGEVLKIVESRTKR